MTYDEAVIFTCSYIAGLHGGGAGSINTTALSVTQVDVFTFDDAGNPQNRPFTLAVFC